MLINPKKFFYYEGVSSLEIYENKILIKLSEKIIATLIYKFDILMTKSDINYLSLKG